MEFFVKIILCILLLGLTGLILGLIGMGFKSCISDDSSEIKRLIEENERLRKRIEALLNDIFTIDNRRLIKENKKLKEQINILSKVSK